MGPKRKILFISHEASLSGAPIYLLNLIRHLKGLGLFEIKILLRSAGPLEQEFHALAPTYTYYKKIIKNSLIDKIVYNLNRGRDRRLAAAKLFRDWNPDLIYSNTVANGEFIELADSLGIPVIVNVLELADTIKSIGRKNLENLIHVPKHYIAVSEAVRLCLNRDFSIPPEKITKIHNFIDIDRVIRLSGEIAASSVKEKLNIPAAATVIGGVGRIIPRKGVDYFLEVAAEISKITASAPVFFLWVGGPLCGEFYEKVLKTARSGALTGKTRFTGIQRNPYPFYNIFDIFLMPSREDPFPVANLEIAALKKPIICFGGSGGSEEFVGNDCGFVVKGFSVNAMAERVKELINLPGLRKKFGEAAYLKAKEICNGNEQALRLAGIISKFARI